MKASTKAAGRPRSTLGGSFAKDVAAAERAFWAKRGVVAERFNSFTRAHRAGFARRRALAALAEAEENI